jgi:hypothetical protein
LVKAGSFTLEIQITLLFIKRPIFFSAEQKLVEAQKENDHLVAQILDMKEKDVQVS